MPLLPPNVISRALLGAILSILAVTADRAGAAFTEQGLAVLGGANFDSRSASLADIDDDGDLDLFFQGSFGSQQLFRNELVENGSLAYTNISASLPSGLGSSWSAAWGDYDGDGRIDVFVGQTNNGASGDVLHNDGAGGGFSNTSVATGLNDPGFHQNVAWCDIDADNDLDLIIGMEGPEKHEIYLQGPGHVFTPVGAAVGFQEPFGTKSYGMAIGDYDDDGDFDIYISTCRTNNDIRNNFYKNMLTETGTLSFVDVADLNGTQNTKNSYGSEFHDFDDDGDLDLFMVGADRQPNKIFRNNGDGSFTDVDSLTGHALVDDLGGDFNGARPVDYDNDGDLDLYFHDHLPGARTSYAGMLYRNDGNWQFTNVTTAEGLHAPNQGAYDSVWGDLDRDGDQDLVIPTDGGSDERVYLSDEAANGNHWLYVELAGPEGNTTGIGASLFATINAGTPEERTLRREANTNAGTFAQSDLPVHFGLGTATVIDELRIEWPDGTVQVLANVAVDQYFAVAIVPEPGGVAIAAIGLAAILACGGRRP
ncbi:MAG: CRTAC1 family protein [Planctomycetales bacterium]|nr:CRTAC1 family protein [Planctomycetales bacterium]